MTLTEIREALGLTQLELNERAGLTTNTVHQIEAGGNKNPGIKTCLAIVEALRKAGAKGADVEAIFGELNGSKS